MHWKLNRAWRVVLIVLVVLVGIRLVLPFIVTRHVNRVLSDIDGYHGTIEDVDLHLFRGAYQIHGIKISKDEGGHEVPFIDIPHTDLSIEWESLFQGAVVGEINFEDPVLNFIASKKDSVKGKESSKGETQTGKHTDWTEPIKRLMPIDINRLTIQNGKVAFYDFSTKPEVDIFLDKVQMNAINLNNAKDNPELLPSRVYLQAQSLGGGQLNLAMKINILKETPDMDLDLRFENVNMASLNDFFKAYANVDVSKGNFNLYAEVAVLQGKITGYVKPLFNDLKLVDENDHEQPAQLIWESMVGFLAEVFENQSKDQFATSVPLQGQIAEVNAPFWPALWNIFSNAFIEAFDKNTDGTISIASAEKMNSIAKAPEQKSKKELRKDRRKERKKARKEKKEKIENEKADKRASKDNS